MPLPLLLEPHATPHPTAPARAQSLKRCKLARVPAGGAVLTPAQARRQLMLLIDGVASIVVEVGRRRRRP
jgi:hypothetical protein